MLPSKPNSLKFLYLLVSTYLTFTLLTVCLIYKIIDFHGIMVSAATLIIPFWYCNSDIITEVYGYNTSRNIAWCIITSEFIFIFIAYFLVNLPSPVGLLSQEAYSEIFSQLPRVFIGSVAAIFCGTFSNMYFLSKWKILTRGKYFWIRSVISSSIGELIFTIVAFSIEFIGKMSLHEIFELMLVSYIFKLVFLAIASGPAAILAAILKKVEKIDVFDNNVNFNPFKLNS